MAKANEPPPREPGPWGRKFVRAVHAVTWSVWIGSSLAFLVSLWGARDYRTLAFLAAAVVAFYAAARMGPKESAGKRMMVLTVLVALGVIWLQFR